MIKKISIFFVLIFLISFGFAASLSLSPEQINFIGKTSEEICRKVTINVPEKSKIMGEDHWAKEGFLKRDLNNHNKSAEDLGILISYEKDLELVNSTVIDVCIKAKKEGVYHGALIYTTENSTLKVGIWMKAQIEKEKTSLIKWIIIGILSLTALFLFGKKFIKK